MCAWDTFAAPGVIRQIDGSLYGGLNCAAATAAMHIVSEKQGKRPTKGSPWPPTGASFRAATGDKVGGLLASQVDATSNAVYGIDPDFQVAPASLVGSKLDDGYGLHFLHRYGPIQDAGFNGSAGFRENHSAFISRINRGATGIDRVRDCDPLFDGRHPYTPQGPQWLRWQSFVRAGELLVIRDDGTRMIDRYGPGMLYVGFTRVPFRPEAPVKKIKYSVAFGAGGFYIYDLSGGRIVRRHSRQFSKPTSASCGAPEVFPWPGNVSRRLVRMTAGALRGSYVAVPQGSAKLLEVEVKA